MKKRFTDAEKWTDVWFSELSNDNKVIWFYLLDQCDNAGIIKLNFKHLNFNCSTNISVEDFSKTFGERIFPIDKENWFIPKFCQFQYGINFLQKNSKPIQSAIDRLKELNLLEFNNSSNTLTKELDKGYDTLTKELVKSILTTKDKEQDKEQDKEKDKKEDKVQYKEKVQEEDKVQSKLKKIYQQLIEENLIDINLVNRENIKEYLKEEIPENLNWEEKIINGGITSARLFLENNGITVDYYIDAHLKAFYFLIQNQSLCQN